MLEKITKSSRAWFPRSDYRSTLNGDDSLNVVYDVYEDTGTRYVGEDGHVAVNIVFLHGTGMNKSIWEWYVRHFEKTITNYTFRLGKIIAVDQVNHGDSSVLNEKKLGSVFNWLDGSRDVNLICQRELSPNSPNSFNVLIGHSMGGHQALGCAILAPNLFQLIITLEPVVKMLNIPNSQNTTKVSFNYFNAIKRMSTDTFDSEQQYYAFMKQKS